MLFILIILYTTGIIIAFFLSMILFTKKSRITADTILSIWLFFVGCHLFLFYNFITQNYLYFPYLLGLELSLPFLHPPFLYLYTRYLTKPSPLKLKILWHFLPLLFVVIYFWDFYLKSTSQKIYIYQNKGVGYIEALGVVNIFIIISGITYITLSLLILKKHQKNIIERFSDIENINLNWIKYLIIGICIIWLCIIFNLNEEILFGVIVFYVLFIGYFGINQVGIFSQNTYLPENKTNKNEKVLAIEISPANTNSKIEELETKYKKSSLTEGQANEIHQYLKKVMLEKQLYKNPEISLNILAEQLQTHPNTLSQVINSLENKNFYDYINGLRIVAFKEIVTLPEKQRFTMLALAFECGFNSKTSFNRNFKKHTGLSPSEYLKSNHLLICSEE